MLYIYLKNVFTTIAFLHPNLKSNDTFVYLFSNDYVITKMSKLR